MSSARVNITDVETHERAGCAEAAAPTHAGRCSTCPTESTRPSWDWVDDDGIIRGAYGGGQCGQCGSLGSGWVATGARMLPSDPSEHEPFIAALIIECAGLRDQAIAVARSELRAELVRQLSAALAARPTSAYNDDDDDWLDWAAEHDVSTDDASERPLYFDPSRDRLIAWCHDPSDTGELIIVTEEDLGRG